MQPFLFSKTLLMRHIKSLLICSLLSAGIATAQTNKPNKDSRDVNAEHGMINIDEKKGVHTSNPDAQWYPEASFGLFIHWGLSSVKNLDISWPMIPGRALVNKALDSAELLRVVREKDFNLNGKPPAITPNEYWAMAKSFNPQHYDPDKWIKAAKEAGFKYAVLTTRHHEGFAMWPSEYGDFSTKNYMGGKDLIKPFVDACRKYGLKVGLYYSPPNWYFDRDNMTFIYGRAYQKNPSLPQVDGDLNPRTTKLSGDALQKHQQAYGEMVRGQIKELMTRYGKIDLLWFDGKAPIPNGGTVITQEEIRQMQPGIVMNPRMHGTGDFITFERNPPTQDPGNIWAEFCNTWTTSWANSNTIPFRAGGFVLAQLAACKAWGVNYLLGVGPTADGVFPDQVYTNMKLVQDWMTINKRSIEKATRLPAGEIASVPATANGNYRYLFAVREFKGDGKYDADMLPAKDTTITLQVNTKPKSVKLLGQEGKTLQYSYSSNQLSVTVPASVRTTLVDVIAVEL